MSRDSVIRVRATRKGFYLWIRNTGAVFDVPEDLFADSWMERVGERTPVDSDSTGFTLPIRAT